MDCSLDDISEYGIDCTLAAGGSLHLAAMVGDLDRISNLIHSGADLCQKNVHGESPLDLAVDCKQMKAAKFLLSCSTRAIPIQTLRPLGAALLADLDLSRLLLANPSIWERDPMKGHLVALACRMGAYASISFILQSGADPNQGAVGPWKLSPLHWACWSGDTRSALLLLKANADLNSLCPFGGTPLDYAIESKQPHLAALLSSLGAKPTSRGRIPTLYKAVGHFFGIDANFELGGKQISTMGGTPRTWMGRLIEAMNLLATEKQIKESIESALMLNPKEQLERYRNEEPLLLPSGFVGHSTHFLLWKNRLFLCDRASNQKTTTRPYTIKSALVDEQFIKDLMQRVKVNERKYYTILARALQRVKASPNKELAADLSLSHQTENNCSWASLEGALFLLFACHERVHNGTDWKESTKIAKRRLDQIVGVIQIETLYEAAQFGVPKSRPLISKAISQINCWKPGRFNTLPKHTKGLVAHLLNSIDTGK